MPRFPEINVSLVDTSLFKKWARKIGNYRRQIKILNNALGKWKARALLAEERLKHLNRDQDNVHPIGKTG